EGERRFDITLRWPEELRHTADDILDIPVEVVKNVVTLPTASSVETASASAARGLSATGTNLTLPALTGSSYNGPTGPLLRVPHRRLRDLVTPLNEHGEPDPGGNFVLAGAATINREQGQRLIAAKFSVRGRDLAGTVADAQAQTAPILARNELKAYH